MIVNYLKLGFRNLVKNKFSSLVIILSLALAVACCIVVFAFFDRNLHLDTFHRKLDRLFIVERITRNNGNEQYWGNDPAPLGPALRARFSQIRDMTRVKSKATIITKDDESFRENITFVDSSFCRMFDFPVRWGDLSTFNDRDGIVLTAELSAKYFGHENPVGKNIRLSFAVAGQTRTTLLTVKGVLGKKPDNTSWYFSALVPFDNLKTMVGDGYDRWDEDVDISFVESESSPADMDKLPLGPETQLYNRANPTDPVAAFHFEPLKKINVHASLVNKSSFVGSPIAVYIILLTIATATILLVCFNYINVLTASAGTRFKEIGVRKVLGSRRWQIVVQFVLENFVVCGFAVLSGVLLAKGLFLPAFNKMANTQLEIPLLSGYRTWIFLSGLTIVLSVGAAIYPAVYVTGFRPRDILQGNARVNGNSRLRRTLLGLQYFLTFLALVSTIALRSEARQLQNKAWGYDPSNTLVFHLSRPNDYPSFYTSLINSGSVMGLTGTDQSLGEASTQEIVKLDGQTETVQSMKILPGFAAQMGIAVSEGRDLNKRYGADSTTAVLVNKAFLRQLHLNTVIGKTLQFEGKRYLVVGEMEDFHFEPFYVPVKPMVFIGCAQSEVNYVYVKMRGQHSSQRATVETLWKRICPGQPLEFHYQDLVFDGYFNGVLQLSRVLGATSFIMIVISISGIFGLGQLILGGKMKEISVRKILGAGAGTISFIMSRDFLLAAGLAVLSGAPVAWLLLKGIFVQLLPDSVISPIPFLVSIGTLIAMTLVSICWHIFQALFSKPMRYLKDL